MSNQAFLSSPPSVSPTGSSLLSCLLHAAQAPSEPRPPPFSFQVSVSHCSKTRNEWSKGDGENVLEVIDECYMSRMEKLELPMHDHTWSAKLFVTQVFSKIPRVAGLGGWGLSSPQKVYEAKIAPPSSLEAIQEIVPHVPASCRLTSSPASSCSNHLVSFA